MMYFLKHIYMKTNKSKKDNIKNVEHFKSTNTLLIGLTIAIGIAFIGMIIYVIYKNWFDVDSVSESLSETQYYPQNYNQGYGQNYQQNYNQGYGQNY